MSADKSDMASPFSALTYQEQQDRWLEWRSRQLDYRPVPEEAPEDAPALPPEPRPFPAAPGRRRELDQVISRHAQALKRAGSFQSLTRT